MSKKWMKALGVAGALAVAYVGKKAYDKYKDDVLKKAKELKAEAESLSNDADLKSVINDLEKAKDMLISATEEVVIKELKEVSEKLEQGRDALMERANSEFGKTRVVEDVPNDEIYEEVENLVNDEPQEEKPNKKVESKKEQPVVEKKQQDLDENEVEHKLVEMIKNAKKEIIISVPNLTWEGYENYAIFDILRDKIENDKVYVKINCGVGEIYDWHNQMVESVKETIEVAHQLRKDFVHYSNFNIDIRDSRRKVVICDKQEVLITGYSFLAFPMYLDEVEEEYDGYDPFIGVKTTGTFINSKEYARDLIKTIESVPRRNKEVDAYFILNNF